MNEIILKQAQKFEKEYKEILENIKKFDKIAVFRHIMPDFDALGTQFGLATWLKDNFKDIKSFLNENYYKIVFTNDVYEGISICIKSIVDIVVIDFSSNTAPGLEQIDILLSRIEY